MQLVVCANMHVQQFTIRDIISTLKDNTQISAESTNSTNESPNFKYSWTQSFSHFLSCCGMPYSRNSSFETFKDDFFYPRMHLLKGTIGLQQLHSRMTRRTQLNIDFSMCIEMISHKRNYSVGVLYPVVWWSSWTKQGKALNPEVCLTLAKHWTKSIVLIDYWAYW